MEPVFEPETEHSIKWGQTEDTITIAFQLPQASQSGEPGVVRPLVELSVDHLIVSFPAAASSSADATPVADSSDHEAKLLTLMDADLGGSVLTDQSTWTTMDGVLTLELTKRPDYRGSAGVESPFPPPRDASAKALASDSAREQPCRAPWWTMCVRNGKAGPPDPRAVVRKQPEMERLDGKIGWATVAKTSFQGKSKFQW